MIKGLIVHPEDLTIETIDRMAAAGLNTLGLHPVGGKDAANTLEQAVRWHSSAEGSALLRHAMKKGLNVEYEAHAMGWLLQRELFAEHPQWFRMNEQGERTPDVNLCPSNEEALEYVAGRTAHLARLLETNSHRYFFWMDDVKGGGCRCPKCRALSPSDQQLQVVNAMLRGLKSVHADATLAYIAYLDTLNAPAVVQPEEGVFLEYAPFTRDPDAPMNDSANEKNAAEAAPLPALIEFFGKTGAQVLEYWMDNSMYSGWKRPPKAFSLRESVMRADVPFYRALGFEAITSFGCFLGPDYEELHGRAPIEEYARILSE
ncbi:MAG: DUF4838 domain-containing protein [Eubacteriales bacterium]|nr:DUF4838 domain-containing protein [Eubacteriales bacterium]